MEYLCVNWIIITLLHLTFAFIFIQGYVIMIFLTTSLDRL